MPPGVGVLRRLGLYEAVLATGARPLHGVTYQHEGGVPAASASFPMDPAGGVAPGLGIRRTTFDALLVDALRREPCVTVHEGALVTGLLRDGAGATSGVRLGETAVRAGVVVGADGLHSGVRRWAGLARQGGTGGRYGLAGHWRLDVSDRATIRVTFADRHEWYEAAVGPDTLLVSMLSSQSRPPINARTYETEARAAVPSLRDAALIAGPLGAAHFRQRSLAVSDGRVFLTGDAAGYDDPTTGEGLAIGMLLAERLARHIDGVVTGRLTRAEAAGRYAIDHRRLTRERRRLTQLALVMARTPVLSRRAISSAASDPTALGKLLGINCGYQTFASLTPRDWLSLAGI
jgi:menaquinone-9 beta-reductase